MEDAFRDTIRRLMAERGVSAPEIAREVGLDKAYFIDLLAGRKKSVTAAAFMAIAAAYQLDPWEMAGMTQVAAPRLKHEPKEMARQAADPVPKAQPPALIRASLVVEEAAFRGDGEMPAGLGRTTITPVAMFEQSRQTACLVRGEDYAKWGVADGSVLNAVSFKSYGTVAQPGSLLVLRAERAGGLRGAFIRRSVIDGDGIQHAQSPSGATVPFPDPEAFVGLVVATQFRSNGDIARNS
jgi:transcriptional regulator with XRE-family HTH domain